MIGLVPLVWALAFQALRLYNLPELSHAAEVRRTVIGIILLVMVGS